MTQLEEMKMVEHEDNPNAVVTMPDGRVVRNLGDDEYAETYNDPGLTLHSINSYEDEEGDDDGQA